LTPSDWVSVLSLGLPLLISCVSGVVTIYVAFKLIEHRVGRVEKDLDAQKVKIEAQGSGLADLRTEIRAGFARLEAKLEGR